VFAEMRAVKDEEETAIIRECCALCDLGQNLNKELVKPRITELELFEEVRKGMEMHEGGRMAILADMVSGPRTAQIGGSPSQRVIEAGDPIICDLVPRHRGYWGDSCNSCVVGTPNKEQEKFFAGVSKALAEAIDMVRPGLQACTLDVAVRTRGAGLGGGYLHHTGHGLGLTWHEEPRIVPYNTQRLCAGMIIAVEPGIYFEGRWGMRLEYVVRVTESSSEILSKFQHSL
jgi:Xaa-Pro dipeptidase